MLDGRVSKQCDWCIVVFLLNSDYKDRKCAVNENLSLRIVASIHYNAMDKKM